MVRKPRDEQEIEHGTARGWKQHYRRGEPGCPECCAARSAERSEAKATKTASDVAANEKARRTLRQYYTTEQAIPLSNIGRTTFFARIKSGEIPVERRGLHTWVAVGDIPGFVPDTNS